MINAIQASMKLLKTSFRQYSLVIATLLVLPLTIAAVAQSGDPGWPREKSSNGNRLVVFQPQVDDWKNFHVLSWGVGRFGGFRCQH